MNRRQFIKNIIVGVAGLSLSELEISNIEDMSANMNDRDFIIYVTTYINLMVNNPAQCGMITNIEE